MKSIEVAGVGFKLSFSICRARPMDQIQFWKAPMAFHPSVTLAAARNCLTSDPLTLKNFLIGRQVFVILLVFILAGLTSSDQQYLPFTEIRVPEILALVIFKLGFLGALLTFWLGQISGKILASQEPVRFLNFPLQVIIVRLAILIANSGLAYPVEKLVRARVSLPAVSVAPKYCDFSSKQNVTLKRDRHGIFH